MIDESEAIWFYRIDVDRDTRHGFRYFRHIINHGCKLSARMLKTAIMKSSIEP